MTAVTFHPIHHDIFVSGSYEGAMMHWTIELRLSLVVRRRCDSAFHLRRSNDQPLAVINEAHEGSVHGLAFHPIVRCDERPTHDAG